jgi:hypothetical protein
MSLRILPAVALALIKPNILPCGGIFNDSSEYKHLLHFLTLAALETHKLFLHTAVSNMRLKKGRSNLSYRT